MDDWLPYILTEASPSVLVGAESGSYSRLGLSAELQAAHSDFESKGERLAFEWAWIEDGVFVPYRPVKNPSYCLLHLDFSGCDYDVQFTADVYDDEGYLPLGSTSKVTVYAAGTSPHGAPCALVQMKRGGRIRIHRPEVCPEDPTLVLTWTGKVLVKRYTESTWRVQSSG